MESSNSDYQVDGPPATNNVNNMMTNQEKSQNNNSQQKQSQSKSPFESSPLTLNDNINFKANLLSSGSLSHQPHDSQKDQLQDKN